MDRLIAWVRRFIRELRRRRVIRVAVVYGTTAFVILQLAEILTNPFGLGSWAIRLVTFLLVLGFPLAVGLAWVYNFTEEGVVRAGVDVETEGELGPGGKPLTSNWLIVGLLAVAIGLLLYPRVFSSGGQQPSRPKASADTAQVKERSVAVLPFSNLSGQKEARPLTRGLHDDLLTRLSNVGDLTVISRTSVEKYRDTDLSIPAIADSLGVRWILEGGVQKAGERIQVNAQLIDPRTDAHRWAESYQRKLTAENLFAIQGEIAGEIAEALEAKLTAGEQKRIAGAPTRNLEAYRLYTEGRQLLAQASSREEAVRAASYFGRALDLDSTYALAWAGLADSRVMEVPDSLLSDSLRFPDVSQEAAARRALRLAPNLAEAHTSMGIVRLEEGNGPQAVRHLRRALELKPSYWEAHHRLGVFYLKIGRVQEALGHLQVAVELNPEHAWARHGLYDAYLAAGQAQKSLKEARLQQRLGLEETAAIGGEVRALRALGRYEEAGRIAEEQVNELGLETGWGGWFQAYLVSIAAAKGDTARARKQLERLEAAEVRREQLAQGYAAVGEVDKALEAYQKLSEETWRSFGASVEFRYGIMYDLAPLRADPRYEELIQKANRAWGLTPDGSIPDSVDTSFPSRPEDDA